MHVSADFDNATNGPNYIDERAFEMRGPASMWLGRKRVYTWRLSP